MTTAAKMPTPMTGKKKNYSLTFKLAVIKSAKETSCGAASRLHNVNGSMVRRWKQKEVSLKGVEQSTTCRGRARARLVGGGKTLLLCDLEDELFGWIVAERQQCRRVTRKSVQAMAKRIHDEQGGQEPFNVSAGRCRNFMEHLQLMTRVKTHQSHQTPADLIPN